MPEHHWSSARNLKACQSFILDGLRLSHWQSRKNMHFVKRSPQCRVFPLKVVRLLTFSPFLFCSNDYFSGQLQWVSVCDCERHSVKSVGLFSWSGKASDSQDKCTYLAIICLGHSGTWYLNDCKHTNIGREQGETHTPANFSSLTPPSTSEALVFDLVVS